MNGSWNAIKNRIHVIAAIRGGCRENLILNDKPSFRKTETWNKEHRVIEVIASSMDETGRRNSFYYDLVTDLICG